LTIGSLDVAKTLWQGFFALTNNVRHW